MGSSQKKTEVKNENMILLVDLDAESSLQSKWEFDVASLVFPWKLKYCSGVAEALPYIENHSARFLAIFANSFSQEVGRVIQEFQSRVGCLPEFQVMVCSEPSPIFMASVFEYGVDEFVDFEGWAVRVSELSNLAYESLAEEDSPETAIITAQKLQMQGKTLSTNDDEFKSLLAAADHDYRAAYTVGIFHELASRFEKARESFRGALQLRSIHRQSSVGLGESLLALGQYEEALEIFKGLEKTNSYSAEHKAKIAETYFASGNVKAGRMWLERAQTIQGNDASVQFAVAWSMLCAGQYIEAVDALRSLASIRSIDAYKINRFAVELSKANKVEQAMELYALAYKHVPQQLRYKVSLNQALGSVRLGDKEQALQYIERCRKDYGGWFDKLKRIRDAVAKK